MIGYMKLTKTLFWDTDYSKLDFENNARKIIERVISMGNLSDWYQIQKYYGSDRIKKEVTQIRYLDVVSLNFCCHYFNLKKEDFRCYTLQRSNQPQLWQF